MDSSDLPDGAEPDRADPDGAETDGAEPDGTEPDGTEPNELGGTLVKVSEVVAVSCVEICCDEDIEDGNEVEES